MPDFIQFFHSGAEHTLTAAQRKNKIKEWNTSYHYRKFLEAKGQYVNASGHLCNGKLRFWGEWEPASKVQFLNAQPSGNGLPHYLHFPFLGVRPNNGVNTDPCVFGPQFMYSLCRQSSPKRKSRMSCLQVGSIIVFGSVKNYKTPNEYFAVDTVFVVADGRDYTPNTASTALKGYVTADYQQIMGPNMGAGSGTHQLRCYKGATFHQPVDGMYSFVPCRVSDDSDVGFLRPHLTVKDMTLLLSVGQKQLISKHQNQGTRIERDLPIADIVRIWNTLRSIFREQGFKEGVYFDCKKQTRTGGAKTVSTPGCSNTVPTPGCCNPKVKPNIC